MLTLSQECFPEPRTDAGCHVCHETCRDFHEDLGILSPEQDLPSAHIECYVAGLLLLDWTLQGSRDGQCLIILWGRTAVYEASSGDLAYHSFRTTGLRSGRRNRHIERGSDFLSGFSRRSSRTYDDRTRVSCMGAQYAALANRWRGKGRRYGDRVCETRLLDLDIEQRCS